MDEEIRFLEKVIELWRKVELYAKSERRRAARQLTEVLARREAQDREEEP